MGNHRSAWTALQRLVTGVPVPEDEVGRAVTHLASCDECACEFEVEDAAALTECKEDTFVMDDTPVDSEALFEHALAAALDDPDSVTRRRAAERLGERAALSPGTLAALARCARGDTEQRVRAAARAALDRLDAQVTELTNPMRDDRGGVTLTGERGVSGRIAVEDDLVWITMNGLPETFDNTKPWVAFPGASEPEWPAFAWAGGEPGLVGTVEPVHEGCARVLLGDLTGAPRGGEELEGRPVSSAADHVDLFEHVYLIDTGKRPYRRPRD